MSPTSRARRPTWLAIALWPKGTLKRPVSGTRPAVGRKPTMPQKAAGTRTDPPMSLPRPRGDPHAATIAPSPPLLPPDDRSGFQGLLVRP